MLRRLVPLVAGGWSESVIRRASTLLAFTLPAMLLNLALTYSASHLLESREFGIFYAAITAINILFAPAVVVNLFFSRFVATIFSRDGQEAALGSLRIVLATVGRWLGVASIIGMAGVLLLGGIGRMFSPTLGGIIIAVAVTAYLAECGRVILQGGRKFLSLGIYTLTWMASRLVLGITGLWLLGTVWGGLVGVTISALIAFLMFFGLALIRSKPSLKAPQAPRFSEIIPFAIGYALFAAAAHADILVAYLTLDPVHLGIYSASSVLPKGLLMVSMPIIQLAFPLMVGQQVDATPGVGVMAKGLVLTGALCSVGAATIFALRGPVCSSAYGLAACDPHTMFIAALAMVPFGILRFLVSVDFSARRDWIPSLLIVPTLAYLAFVVPQQTAPENLAVSFVIFALATLAPYPLLRFLQPRRGWWRRKQL